MPRRIISGLVARLRPGLEPDNTDVAGLPRSTVRQSLAYAVLLYVYNHGLPRSLVDELSEMASSETDRYVAGMLYHSIARSLGQQTATGTVIERLLAQRWSPPPRIETEGLRDLAGIRSRDRGGARRH